MIVRKQVATMLAVFVAVNLVSAMAFGALSDYAAQSFTDGEGKLWNGSTDFPIPPDEGSPLYGHVDWAVFAPGAFPFAGGGYTPTPGEFTYVYQVIEEGPAAISLYAVAMENPADNIGWFNFGSITGTAPSDETLYPFESAEWDFPGFSNGAASSGLVYSSPYGPEDLYGIVLNGGHIAVSQPVPSPGTYTIPEPSALVMLTIGLALAGVAAKRRFA
jgi:hypothetical protein